MGVLTKGIPNECEGVEQKCLQGRPACAMVMA